MNCSHSHGYELGDPAGFTQHVWWSRPWYPNGSQTVMVFPPPMLVIWVSTQPDMMITVDAVTR